MKDKPTGHAHEHRHHPSHSKPEHAPPLGARFPHRPRQARRPYPGDVPGPLFVSLLLTLPILYFSEQLQTWLGYRALAFPGSAWVNPVLGTILYFYGGLVFLKGPWGSSASGRRA